MVEPAENAGVGDRVVAETAATARAVAGVGAVTPPAPTATAVRPPPLAPGVVAAGAQPAGPSAPPSLPTPTSAPTKPTVRPTLIPTASPLPPPTASPTPGTVFRKEKPITYAAIGASDTVGVGAPDPLKDGWVPQLHRRLPPGSKLVNLGISGARLSDALAKELPRALETKPDLVTVWNVVNDLNAAVDLVAYERDMDRLLGELVGKTPARVLVGNCPDLARVPAYIRAGIPAEALRQEVGRWNASIVRATGRHPARVHLVDLYARSGEIDVDSNLVAGDDFHPSARGYTKIAEVFWEAMVANRLSAA